VRRVPVALLSGIVGVLGTAGLVSARARDKAELARIGRYYATQSMLVWTGAGYDADRTPRFGTETLADHYAHLLSGDRTDDRGAHAVF
jgi:divinyl chlorophyllide a 8-vinyl-reductase